MDFWLTADTHLHHKNLHTYFRSRPSDFAERILKGLRQIPSGVVLIHLGDVVVGRAEPVGHEKIMRATAQCRTRVMIRGNHDKKTLNYYYDQGWDLVVDNFSLRVFDSNILFSHRPIPRDNKWDYNIHGHTHGNSHRDIEVMHFYDPSYNKEIALESTNYRPVKLSRKLLDLYDGPLVKEDHDK